MPILSNFIFQLPETISSVSDCTALLWNGEGIQENSAIQFSTVIRFNTFFNVFPMEFYAKHTSISNIVLTISAKGRGVLVVKGVSVNNGETVLFDQFVELCGKMEFVIPIIENCSYCYAEVHPQGVFVVESAHWGTSSPPRIHPKFPIIICSYNRQAELLGNIHRIRLFKEQYSSIDCKIMVVDNAQRLSQEMLGEDVLLYTNPHNMGGSGGFARGIFEAGKDVTYTHAILMDDDGVIEPEIIFRINSMLRYSKASRQFALGGVMLNKEKPAEIVEWGATFKGHPVAIARGRDVADAKNLVTPANHVDYCAWTLFCYPLMENVRNELPVPLFIRADDAEFGLRLKSKYALDTVTCVGIGVWHNNFGENNAFTLYNTLFNEIIVNIKYSKFSLCNKLRYLIIPLYYMLSFDVVKASVSSLAIYHAVVHGKDYIIRKLQSDYITNIFPNNRLQLYVQAIAGLCKYFVFSLFSNKISELHEWLNSPNCNALYRTFFTNLYYANANATAKQYTTTESTNHENAAQ